MRNLSLAASLFIASCGAPASPPKPLTAVETPSPSPPQSTTLISPSEFRDRVVAAIKKAHPDVPVETISDVELQLNKAGAQIQIDISSGYMEYRSAPDSLSSIVDKWVGLAGGMSAGPDTASMRETLVIVLRNKTYASIGAKNGQAALMITRPFGGDLVQTMMIDSPATLASATLEMLKAQGIAEAEAWTLAEANTKRRMGELNVGDLDRDGPFGVTAESGLATGALLTMCGGDNSRAEDGSVVLVVNRDLFIKTLPNDPLSAERFWAFAKPQLGQGTLMSDTPLTCKKGKWVEVKAPT